MIINNRFDEKDDYTENAKLYAVLENGEQYIRERSLLCEHRITVFVNEKPAMTLVCTPTSLSELIIGRLISEGIVDDINAIDSLNICERGLEARVFLKDGMNLCECVPEIESCCPDNRVYLKNENFKNEDVDAVKSCDFEKNSNGGCFDLDTAVNQDAVFRIIDTVGKDMNLHRATSGTHSCYLFISDELIFSCEDIGRHNALDKVIGYISMKGLEPSQCIVFTTGRIPVDMVNKAVHAKIGTLMTKSVPTMDAVELAASRGLQLICRAWPDGFEIY